MLPIMSTEIDRAALWLTSYQTARHSCSQKIIIIDVRDSPQSED